MSYPASCRLSVNILYLPASVDEEGRGGNIRREVEDWVLAAAATDPWLVEHPPTFEWGPDLGPFDIGETIRSSRSSATAAADGRELTLGGLDSWFDAASFNRLGRRPMVGFGAEHPPAFAASHKPSTSRGRIDDLVRCAQTLAVTVMRWCGVAST